LDYEKQFGFTSDETRHWVSLAAPEKLRTGTEIATVVFTNFAIAALLIYSTWKGVFWIWYLAITWILILTAQAISNRLSIRRSRATYRAIVEKVESAIANNDSNERSA
jgi:uncharacterized membrane protein YfcA